MAGCCSLSERKAVQAKAKISSEPFATMTLLSAKPQNSAIALVSAFECGSGYFLSRSGSIDLPASSAAFEGGNACSFVLSLIISLRCACSPGTYGDNRLRVDDQKRLIKSVSLRL